MSAKTTDEMEETDRGRELTRAEFETLAGRLAKVKATDNSRVRRRVYAHAAKMAAGRRRRKIARRAVAAGAAAVAVVAVTVAGIRMMRPAGGDGMEFAPASNCAMLLTDGRGGIELTDRDTTISVGSVEMAVRGGELVVGTGAAATRNRIVVPRGGVFTVRLPDGTRVMLNSGWELAFPSAFAADRREVVLGGEGYFEVAHDPARPFSVGAGDGLGIRVLGTKFNVMAYADLQQAQVTLVEGSVGVSGAGSALTLVPDQQAIFDRAGGSLLLDPDADASAATAWTRGYFDFEAASLGVIIKSLERWYDADIIARGVDLDSLGIFSLRMSRNGDMATVLETLREITGLDYRADGRTIYLFRSSST
jgi:ferric-dicitrate binding protein FerR (iron transport regulator)